jgi:haloalkane dehalogenase
MGQSGPPPDGAYRFAGHARIRCLPETLGLTADVTLVLHDWGSALGHRLPLTAASSRDRHGSAVAPSLARLSERARPDLPRLGARQGRAARPRRQFFIETVVPKSIIRRLSDAEMDATASPSFSGTHVCRR